MKKIKRNLAISLASVMAASCINFSVSALPTNPLPEKMVPGVAGSVPFFDITTDGATGLTGTTEFTCDLKITSPLVTGAEAGIIFYTVGTPGSSYGSGSGTSASNAFLQYKLDGSGKPTFAYYGASTSSNITSPKPVEGDTYAIKIVATGTNYDLWINNTKINTTAIGVKSAGSIRTIAFYDKNATDGSNFEVSNVKIKNEAYTEADNNTLAYTVVNTKEVESIAASTLSVRYGTPVETVKTKLPTTVKVHLSDSTTVNAPVEWTEGTYNATTPGTYSWTGKITTPEGIENPSNITEAKLEITVDEALSELVAGEPTKAEENAYTFPAQEGTANFEFWVNTNEKDPNVAPTLNSIIALGGAENNMAAQQYPGQKMPIVIRAYRNSETDISFDAFNGGAAAKLAAVPVQANGKYKLNVSVDLTTQKFDLSVNGIQIADDYAFRASAATPTSISKMTVFGNAAANVGEIKVTSLKVGEALTGGFTAASTLNVASVEQIENISVAPGTKIEDLKLPKVLKVTTDTGAQTSLAVTWESEVPAATIEATEKFVGTLTLTEGITNTSNIKAEVEVEVELGTITAVSPVSPVKVVEGTPVGELKLPATVNVTINETTTAKADVTWDTTNYSPEIGEYTLTGTITPPAGVKNTNELTAEVVVTVAEKSEEPVGDFQALTEALDSAKFLLDDTTKSIHPKAKLYLEETIEAAETFQTETPSATEEEVLTQAGIVNQAREYAEAADLTEVEAIVAELAASDIPSATPYAALAQTRLDELKALDFVVDAEVVTLYKDMISNYAEVVNAGTADIEGLETRVASLEAEVATGKYHVSLDAWTDWARTLLTALQESTWVPSTEEIAACESVVATAEGLLTTTEISAINALVEEVLNMGTEAEGYAWASFIQLRLQDPYLDAASLAEYQSILEGFLA